MKEVPQRPPEGPTYSKGKMIPASNEDLYKLKEEVYKLKAEMAAVIEELKRLKHKNQELKSSNEALMKFVSKTMNSLIR